MAAMLLPHRVWAQSTHKPPVLPLSQLFKTVPKAISELEHFVLPRAGTWFKLLHPLLSASQALPFLPDQNE